MGTPRCVVYPGEVVTERALAAKCVGRGCGRSGRAGWDGYASRPVRTEIGYNVGGWHSRCIALRHDSTGKDEGDG